MSNFYLPNSSMSHELQLSEGGIQFGTLSQADGESPIVHYNRSKLANILYAKALARRLEEGGHDKVYVNAIHPGYVLTDIDVGIENTVGTVMAKFATTFRRVVGRDVEVGALTQLYCATSPEIEEKGLSGRYFVPDAHELRPSECGGVIYARDMVAHSIRDAADGFTNCSHLLR